MMFTTKLWSVQPTHRTSSLRLKVWFFYDHREDKWRVLPETLVQYLVPTPPQHRFPHQIGPLSRQHPGYVCVCVVVWGWVSDDVCNSGSGWLYEYESEVARVKSNVINMRPEKVFQQTIYAQRKKIFTTNVCMITLLLMKEVLIENAESQGKLILDSVLCTSNITTASKHTSIHNVYSKWSTFFICFRYSKFHYYLRVLCCCASQLSVNIPHGQQVLRGRPCQTTWVHRKSWIHV